MFDMSTVVYYIVALRLSNVVAVLIKQCQAILSNMANNSKWQGAQLLVQAAPHLAALATAEQATHKGSPADTAARDDALKLVRSDMRQLKALVQAAADADPANAKSIIEGAGMNVVKRVRQSKPPLAVKFAMIPGAASLSAKRVKGALIYQWQMSTDQKSWSDLPWSKQASTEVTGLTPATIYYFRVRVLSGAGTSDWSAAISYIAQ
jgi:hypothetical protein